MGLTFEYVREFYGVPAKRGRRVRFTSRYGTVLGTITAPAGAHIRIRLDGDKKSSGPYHPTWQLEYLDDEGNVIFPVQKVQDVSE